MRIKKAASGAPPQVYLMLPDLQVTKLTPRATTQMPVSSECSRQLTARSTVSRLAVDVRRGRRHLRLEDGEATAPAFRSRRLRLRSNVTVVSDVHRDKLLGDLAPK